MRTALLLVLVSGCGSAGPMMMTQEDAGTASYDAAASMPDASSPLDAATADTAITDVDGDGLDDAKESAWASEYFPYYGIHPSDGCKTHGVLYRLSPHPKEKGHVAIWYDVLYDNDCGSAGHA